MVTWAAREGPVTTRCRLRPMPKSDRTTKALLGIIALGVWLNVWVNVDGWSAVRSLNTWVEQWILNGGPVTPK